MSSWFSNGLRNLRRLRVNNTIGAMPPQSRGLPPPHFGAQAQEIQIPAKPKKPLTPYFRFLGQVRTEIQKENPSLKTTEIMKLVGQKWEHLDEATKESYNKAYKTEMESYTSILEEYKKSLTPAQIEAERQIKLEKQLLREKRGRKKSQKDVDEFQKPLSSHFPYPYQPEFSPHFSQDSYYKGVSYLSKGGVGEAIQIVNSNGEHSFELNEGALEKLLLQDDIKDLPIAVVSIAGAFRKGKSFMLDFFLRYLRSGGQGNWIGKDDEALHGFSWRGGAERDTNGILFWSQIFKVKVPSGEEIAVLLMDTQGAFDSQSTVRDCATIFALSTMTSSVQIYNLTQNIQEDDLQHLQLFTEYGRLALEDCGDTPFQKLQFLVRDWSYPYEAAYGLEGGQKILERRLQVSQKQHHELQSLRKHIRSCFADISCYLMPHPGLKVATNPNFDGRLSEMETDFRKQLAEFVPLVLHPSNLLVKRIAGNKVKAKELLHYLKAYTAVFQGNELPEPKSMLEATAEADNLSTVASAKEIYLSSMEDACGDTKPYMSTAELENEHNRIKETAMNHFQSRRKMGGDEFSIKYRDRLDKEIEDQFINFRTQNERKNILETTTPGTLVKIAASCYVLSGIFGLFGMYSFANLFNLILGVTLLVPAVWPYVRYSGELREIGSRVASGASTIWEYVRKAHKIYKYGRR